MNLIAEDSWENGQKRQIADNLRREEVLAAYEQSGMTQKAFAQKQGVKYHTLVKWLGESRRGEVTPAVRFARVRVGRQVQPETGWSFEIGLPNGCMVRATTAQAVVELIKLLRA